MNIRQILLVTAAFFLLGVQAERSWAPTVRGGAASARTAFGIKSPATSTTTTATARTNNPFTKSSQESKQALDAFLSRDSRTTFIARVYGILTGQLAVTAAVVTLFDRNPQWSRWMTRSGALGPAIPTLSLLLSTLAWFTMSKSASARRKAPLKWNLLALFTAGEAISVGFITSFFKFHSVVQTMGVTALATAAVGLYTILNKNPRYDLSQWGSSISSVGMVILSFGVIHLLELLGVLPHGFMPYSDFWYSAASACLFCAYLAYHTRLIVAGKYSKYQMNEKDYIFGAMTLYNDMISLFVYLLKMFGEEDH